MAAEREPLELRVYQHLLQKVSTRHWEPGVFLRPSSLATSLNVSRSTVRKALTRLVSDGWVQQTAEGYTYADAPPQNAPQDLESVLDHESQVEATYWLIFDWVLHAEFRGGDVVIPRTFADRFSVSMATVRHALDWLTRDGVLVRAPAAAGVFAR